MGQKVNPRAFRLGLSNNWSSRWFVNEKQEYRKLLLEDYKLRQLLLKRLRLAGIAQVGIERSIKSIRINLHVARPGVVIGRGGANFESLKLFVNKILNISSLKKDKRNPKVEIKILEIKNPDLSARLLLNALVDQLVRRFPHRRAVAKTMERAMAAGAKGVKIRLSGRIAGADIGRAEVYNQGKVPLQTLRADIDYAEGPALTKYGFVGVKVWVYKGERKI